MSDRNTVVQAMMLVLLAAILLALIVDITNLNLDPNRHCTTVEEGAISRQVCPQR